jgi:hypothetical protein
MKIKPFLILFLILILGCWFSGCATFGPPPKSPLQRTAQGTVVYDEEFEFALLPPGWKLIQVESGGEFGFGFLKVDPGAFPSQSMFVYDEEPFGCTTKFEDREKEFFKRFLWNSVMNFQVLERKKFQLQNGEGLAVTVEGKDPVRKEKAKAEVIFGKRGERVVAWYITQWRHIDGTYDPSAFEVFEKFAASFKYLKKSFYETL